MLVIVVQEPFVVQKQDLFHAIRSKERKIYLGHKCNLGDIQCEAIISEQFFALAWYLGTPYM